MTTNGNGNGWRMFALQAVGALLLLFLGWLGNGIINDHQKIQDLERRIVVLESERKR